MPGAGNGIVLTEPAEVISDMGVKCLRTNKNYTLKKGTQVKFGEGMPSLLIAHVECPVCGYIHNYLSSEFPGINRRNIKVSTNKTS